MSHWSEHAACREMDPAPFFVDKGESTEPAKAVCAACPVIRECLDYALRHRIRFGVWGGLDETQRRPLRRRYRLRAAS